MAPVRPGGLGRPASRPAGRPTRPIGWSARPGSAPPKDACRAPGRLPNARPQPAVGLGRPLADRDGVQEWAAALGQALAPRVAHRPTSTQTTPQLTSQRPTAPDVQAQIDGLMGDPHGWVIGIGQPQPARDLPRRPAQPQLGLHDSAQLRLHPAWTAWAAPLAGRRPRQLAGLDGDSGRRCGPAPATPLRRSSQPTSDRPAGVASSHAPADLLPLDCGQQAGRALRWALLDATGLQHNPSYRGPRLPIWRAISGSD